MNIRVDWLILLFVPLAVFAGGDDRFFNFLATASVWFANSALGLIGLALVCNWDMIELKQTSNPLTGIAWMSATIGVLIWDGWIASAYFIGITYVFIHIALHRIGQG